MRYREGLKPVLDDLSLTVRAGEKVGLVGRTGAGKSSILVALFRVAELREGSIAVDGVDIAVPEGAIYGILGPNGAGKTTTLRVLEDLGWEAVDNFPVRLLRPLVREVLAGQDRTPLAIGFDSRTRGFNPATTLAIAKSIIAKRARTANHARLDSPHGTIMNAANTGPSAPPVWPPP